MDSPYAFRLGLSSGGLSKSEAMPKNIGGSGGAPGVRRVRALALTAFSAAYHLARHC